MKKVYEGNIVDLHKREIYKGRVVVQNKKIESIEEAPVKSNDFIFPPLVDSHVHIESSMLVPSEFAALAVQHGTVATVSDPHEIANVLGLEGVEFMVSNAQTVPFKFNFTVPSCVPATTLETAGAYFTDKDVAALFDKYNCCALSEMMNVPGVLHNDSQVMQILEQAKKRNKPIDGHAPALTGDALTQYAAAGITTDHEAMTLDEGEQRIRNGMFVQIREGSAAKNFNILKELISKHPESVMLCSDDLHPDDLVKGHINLLIKRGLQSGISIFDLLRAAVLNPVQHYNLPVGTLKKGDPADFIVVDSLENFTVLKTVINGQTVWDGNNVCFQSSEERRPNRFAATPITKAELKIPAQNGNVKIISALDGNLYTNVLLQKPLIKHGEVVADPQNDVLKIAVLNRYEKSAPAVGLIHNFGLKTGAIASSVAHDSHNIVAVGTNDADMEQAINGIIINGGGIAAVAGNDFSVLPLPVGGIMSNKPGCEVAAQYELLDRKAKQFGSHLQSPFMTLSFMALLVIPELKMSDKGLFDGQRFELTSLFTNVL